MAELRERGVALVAGDQHVRAVLGVRPDAHRYQLAQERDRLRERIDLFGDELLADVLVVADLAERDHLNAGDRGRLWWPSGPPSVRRPPPSAGAGFPDPKRPSGRNNWEGSGPRTQSQTTCFSATSAASRRVVLHGTIRPMSGIPADLPPGSAVVLTNPDEDASPEAFRAFIDELLAGPEPELESVHAAEALRALRVDAQA